MPLPKRLDHVRRVFSYVDLLYLPIIVQWLHHQSHLIPEPVRVPSPNET